MVILTTSYSSISLIIETLLTQTYPEAGNTTPPPRRLPTIFYLKEEKKNQPSTPDINSRSNKAQDFFVVSGAHVGTWPLCLCPSPPFTLAFRLGATFQKAVLAPSLSSLGVQITAGSILPGAHFLEQKQTQERRGCLLRPGLIGIGVRLVLNTWPLCPICHTQKV